MEFNGGTGGNGVSGSGATAGHGGDIRGITVTDSWQTQFQFIPGDGGNATGPNTGGNGGAASGITLKAPNASAEIYSGYGGNGGTSGGGGAGGIITKVSGIIARGVIHAGNGGNATNSAGGAGGDVMDNALTVTQFLHRVQAGNGGNSTNASGGLGGEITKLKISSDIGNFARTFGSSNNDAGGLIAGLGGNNNAAGNGSVSFVTAGRIAAIFAGFQSGNASNQSAVASIANITARVIGADLDGDEVFDFVNAGTAGFQLGTSDFAQDGLVIVFAGGLDEDTVKAAPLKVVTVTPPNIIS
jgi:hypothetical protein